MMDRAQKLAALKRWHAAMDQADTHFDSLIDLMGLHPDGDTCNAVFGLQDALTSATADLVDDGSNWINWYWLENDMGRKGMEAAPEGGGLRPVCTLDDLLDVMGAK